MARNQSDREDLWAEAVGLVSRVEWRVDELADPVLIGFRSDDVCSIYVGQDVLLQFSPDGGLRRAFRDGYLYRSQGRTLARLRREQTEAASHLLRHDLTPDELREFQDWARATVARLRDAAQAGRFLATRETTPLTDRILATFRQILAQETFLSPPINAARQA